MNQDQYKSTINSIIQDYILRNLAYFRVGNIDISEVVYCWIKSNLENYNEYFNNDDDLSYLQYIKRIIGVLDIATESCSPQCDIINKGHKEQWRHAVIKQRACTMAFVSRNDNIKKVAELMRSYKERVVILHTNNTDYSYLNSNNIIFWHLKRDEIFHAHNEYLHNCFNHIFDLSNTLLGVISTLKPTIVFIFNTDSYESVLMRSISTSKNIPTTLIRL